jgi:hypothetical protein
MEDIFFPNELVSQQYRHGRAVCISDEGQATTYN